MCIKVAIVGAPSSGKTALAMDVVTQLKKQSIVATFVGEYARKWMSKHKRFTETIQDQFVILSRQKKREDEAMRSQDVVVTDCSTWLGAVYGSLLVRTETDYEESDNIHLCDLIEDTLPSDYTLQYYFPRVFAPHLEKGRVQTEEEQYVSVDRKILSMIDFFHIPVKILSEDHTQWTNVIVKDILSIITLDKICKQHG